MSTQNERDLSATDQPREPGVDTPDYSRRRFLGGLGKGSVALAAASVLGPAIFGGRAAPSAQAGVSGGGTERSDCLIGPLSPLQRSRKAYKLRVDAAKAQLAMPLPDHDCNGDETLYANKLNSYTKGLPHDAATGLVDPSAYSRLIFALSTGKPADFEAIPLTAVGSPLQRKLVDPQAGLAFTLDGADSHALDLPPAPVFASKEAAAEMNENYWMSLLRDVPFTEYPGHPFAQAAAAELDAYGADYKAPRDQDGKVTPELLFRDLAPGCATGPYLSQFWWKDLPYGSQFINVKTQSAVSGLDFGMDIPSWLDMQRGLKPSASQLLEPVLRYMNDGRALGAWLHLDVLFQAYFQAFLSIAHLGMPVNPANPYNTSLTQEGFGTFGGPWFATLTGSSSTHALKSVWFQKWYVHRRARPEAYAGRVEYALNQGQPYPVDPQLANSVAIATLMSRNGTALLPQAFPEGSPLHPSYGSGHATVAGCCTTILKYLFDENTIVPDPVVPSADGQTLLPYTGPALTVGGELNKLAANVAHGRNIAGVHWRSDAREAMLLGEAVAVAILRDQKPTYNENPGPTSLTGLSGNTIVI